MSRKNEEARMILPNGQKYITVLDFEVGKVYQYEAPNTGLRTSKISYNEDCEEYLTGLGHNLGNCEWMMHDSPEIITP